MSTGHLPSPEMVTLRLGVSNTPKVATIAAATTRRVNHLLLAGTTNQGACSRHCCESRPHRPPYTHPSAPVPTRPQRRTSNSSPGCRGVRNRFCCSLRETCRKNLRMTMPVACEVMRSKSGCPRNDVSKIFACDLRRQLLIAQAVRGALAPPELPRNRNG